MHSHYSRQKTKGRRESGQYFGIPHSVAESDNFLRLSYKAVRLLVDIGLQYNGYNNGDLCATHSVMKKRGWISKSTLEEAIAELLHYGMIMVARQGGRHQASLYALTWCAIDNCGGKLDISETKVAQGDWKVNVPDFIPQRKKKKKQLPR